MRERRVILPPPNYDVELIAENGKHNYKVSWDRPSDEANCSVIYPGVTGVLNVISKPALVPWAKRVTLDKVRSQLLDPKNWRDVEDGRAIVLRSVDIEPLLEAANKIPDKLKDDAAALGTEAHAYIDKFIKGESLGPLPDSVLEPVSAFADWWKRSGLSFVAGDTKVASRRHGFGGSLDALAINGSGVLVLLDWKTSKAIYDEYALQVAAYCYAFTETYGISVKRAVCVRFRKIGVTGEPFEALEVRDIPASFEAFLAAKHLQEALKNGQFNRPPKIKKEKTKCPK